MRRFAVLVLVISAWACGADESRSANADAPAQLVIPPMDAGAAVVVDMASAPVADAPRRSTPPDPNEIAERDPRSVTTSIRSVATVANEAQALEALIAKTPPGDPSRPMLLRRAADIYEELARVAQDDIIAKDARKKEADNLHEIMTTFPKHPAMDEVIYYRALTLERARNLSGARSAYYELIKNHPQSPLIPYAYFAFGELFYADAKTDPSKDDLARQAYTEALKYPPPKNGLYAFTLLRIGEVHARQGDDAKAKTMFDRVKREWPASPAAKRVP